MFEKTRFKGVEMIACSANPGGVFDEAREPEGVADLIAAIRAMVDTPSRPVDDAFMFAVS